MTKLNECYRCHPDILCIPNEQFYDGELEARADQIVSHNMVGCDFLPNPGFPMIFHGVQGEHMREASSPSWYNPSEIEAVLLYCDALIGTRGISSANIGIITPYRKQVEKIRVALTTKSASLRDVTVGSCEQFQGIS